MHIERIRDPSTVSAEVISLADFAASYRDALLAHAADITAEAVHGFDPIQILSMCNQTNQNFQNLISCDRKATGPRDLEQRTLHVLQASHDFLYEWIERRLGSSALTDLAVVYQSLRAVEKSGLAGHVETVVFYVTDRMGFAQKIAAHPKASGVWDIESMLASRDEIHASDRLIML